MSTLHDAYMEGYNGQPDKYLWSSNMAEVFFIGQCCRQAKFPPAESITKSRGSSYRLNGSKTAITISYEGEEMSCDIDTIYGNAFYAFA